MKKRPRAVSAALVATALACDHGGLHVTASLKDGIQLNANPASPRTTDQTQESPPGANALALAPLSTYNNCDDVKSDLRAMLTLQMRYYWDQQQYYLSLENQAGGAVAQDDAASSSASSGSLNTLFGSAGAASSAVATSAAAPAASSTAAVSSAAPGNAPAAAPASSNVGTNVQVAGVDEADSVKITSGALFVADNQNPGTPQAVHIYNTNPLSYLNDLVISDLSSAQLYASGSWLIAAGTAMDSGSYAPGINPVSTSAVAISNLYSGYGGGQGTGVRIYDVSTPSSPKLTQGFDSRAQLVASRVIGDQLFLVLQDTFDQNTTVPQPSAQDLAGDWHTFASTLNIEAMFNFTDDGLDDVKCTTLVKFPVYMSQLQYQRIISYNFTTGTVTSDVTIPGNGDTLYMTSSNLYTVGQPEAAPVWQDPSAPSPAAASATAVAANYTVAGGITYVIPSGYTSPSGIDSLIITKVAIDPKTSALTPVARGSVTGHLKLFDSQWAFNEIPNGSSDLLAVVTSTGDLYDPIDNPPSNHLYVLQQNGLQLSIGGEVDGFGNNEDVRAVRYLGNYAYVVTFERTDPLYTIDLTSPLKPTIKGQLNIPGFSMYLQPTGSGHLIGTGFMTQPSGDPDVTRSFFEGLLVQLFDVSNPTAPTQLFSTTLGNRGSYSEANQDAHAFYYDASNNVMAIPTVLFDNKDSPFTGTISPDLGATLATTSASGTGSVNANGMLINTNLLFSGAIFYNIQPNTLQQAALVTHYDIIDSTCQADLEPFFWTTPITGAPDIRRIYRLGSSIYTVSNYAVKTLDSTTFGITGSARVATNAVCPPPSGQEGRGWE